MGRKRDGPMVQSPDRRRRGHAGACVGVACMGSGGRADQGARRPRQPDAAGGDAGRQFSELDADPVRPGRCVPATGRPKIQLNRRGLGWNGNISGTEAIYQQVVHDQSNIYIYDTGTQSRHAPPGVNTTGWEFYPRIDGTNVLFGRSGRHHSWRVLLADTSGPSTTLLEKHTGRPVRQLLPGGVAGDWATWSRYSPRTHHCTVVRYQI